MNLDGKVAIVSGGAMGNGLGIVKCFLEHKARVYILDYSDTLKDVIIKLKKDYPNVSGYLVDLRNYKMVHKVIEDIMKEQEVIDILVNNAGVCKLETFEAMSDEVRDYQFDINIKGTWNLTKEVLPYMKKSKSGRIINLASVTGPMVADIGEVAYATTKAALVGFTKALAMETAENNILVNAIMPGYILTPMVQNIAKETDFSNPDAVLQNIANAIPLKRMGTILELGNLALFLASDECSYITGQTIVIDGGSTLPETNMVGRF